MPDSFLAYSNYSSLRNKSQLFFEFSVTKSVLWISTFDQTFGVTTILGFHNGTGLSGTHCFHCGGEIHDITSSRTQKTRGTWFDKNIVGN